MHVSAFPFSNGPKYEKIPLVPAYYAFFKICCIPQKLEEFYNRMIFLKKTLFIQCSCHCAQSLKIFTLSYVLTETLLTLVQSM